MYSFSKRAFTLIELVIVIVILGILAGLGAFAYQNFITDSRSTAMKTTVEQFARSYSGSLVASNNPATALAAANNDATTINVTTAGSTTPTRVNLSANPSYETSLANTFHNTTGGGGSIKISDEPGLVGNQMLEYTHAANTTNAAGPYFSQTDLTSYAGRNLTLSAYIKTTGSTNRTYRIGMELFRADGTRLGTSSKIFTFTPQWDRYIVDIEIPSDITRGTMVIYNTGTALVNDKVFIDGILVEPTATFGSYFDGSYPNASWVAAAHTSTSRLTLPNQTYWVNLRNNDGTTWCLGLPDKENPTAKITPYTGSGNPPAARYKTSACS